MSTPSYSMLLLVLILLQSAREVVPSFVCSKKYSGNVGVVARDSLRWQSNLLEPLMSTRSSRISARSARSSSSAATILASALSGDLSGEEKEQITSTTNAAVDNNSSKNNKDKIVVVAGATGYIGRAVVREAIDQGYHTIALVRDKAKVTQNQELQACFAGAADVVECNVQNAEQVNQIFASSKKRHCEKDKDEDENEKKEMEAVISCLASPTGTKEDAYSIDYQATLNCLQAGQSNQARHFVLLSAFCVRNPLLQLQQAKLKFEKALQTQSDMTYSIVRPTAFFKSVSGQLQNLQQGAPYVLFGDGAVTRCNPISEQDLSRYLVNCISDPTKKNGIFDLGGPDQPLTNQMLGEMMFKTVGKEPKFVYVPTWIFDSIIAILSVLAALSKSQEMEDAAETARIGKYYAVQDMLTTDPSEKYGSMTMKQHFERMAAKGQDPDGVIGATSSIARLLELLPAFPVAVLASYVLSQLHMMVPPTELTNPDFQIMLASMMNK